MRAIGCLPASSYIPLTLIRERFRRVGLGRKPDAQRAGGKVDRHRDDQHDCDALEIQHESPGKVRLENEDQCQQLSNETSTSFPDWRTNFS